MLWSFALIVVLGHWSSVNVLFRINTKQGQTPPASQCTPALNGREIETVYSATYYMYGANPL